VRFRLTGTPAAQARGLGNACVMCLTCRLALSAITVKPLNLTAECEESVTI